MKLHQLQAVVTIAECGSLRSAGRLLRIAQPALTRSLGELERELGTALFERRARGMVPTAIGATFIRRATLIVNEARRALEEVEQLCGSHAGTVNVCLSISAHLLLLPGGLGPFKRRYPSVQLNIAEGLFHEQEGDLRNGGLDFYLGPRPEGKLHADLVQEILFENARAIVCRKGHPRAGVKSLAELVDADWMAITSTRPGEEEFSGFFRSHALPQPPVRLRGRSALTLISALLENDLIALVPVQWLQFHPVKDLLHQIQVGEALPAPPIVVIRNRQLPLTPAALTLLDLFRRRVAQQGLEERSMDPRGLVRLDGALP